MEKVKSTLSEKIYYAFGNMGSYVLWAFVGVYVTVYVTDCLQPGDALISILGTVILICRLFDGFSDILMGIIIERTNSKYGKARFWFGVSIIPLTIVFFFLFFVSGLDKTASIVTICILYFLFTVIFYTMNNVSFNAMLPRISNDPFDQSNICTIDSVFTSVGGLVSSVAVTILTWFGGVNLQSSWTYLVLILIAICLLGEILCFIKVKEKANIAVQAKQHQSKADLHKGLKALFKCPYFYIAVSMFAINYYISLSVSSVGKYFAQYVLGNVNYYSIFGTVPMVSMAVGLLLTPFLVKKINKKNTLSIAIGFVLLGNIVGSCFPTSFVAGFVAVMIKGFGSAVVMSQLFTLAPDIVTYIEKKEGIRIEGLAASANSFGCKIGSGLGSAVVLWTISACGYISGAETQNDACLTAFTTLYWWVPTGLTVILLILSLLWNIQSKTINMPKGNDGKEASAVAEPQKQ